MSITYTLKTVDLDNGIVEVEINLPGGEKDLVTIDPYSLVSHDDANEIELKAALDQLVIRRLEVLFPPTPPKPIALVGMVGHQYEVGE